MATIGGLGTMMGLQYLLGGGMALPRFQTFAFAPGDIPWMPVFVAAGIALGWLYLAADRIAARISGLFKNCFELRAMACGLVLGLVGMVLPLGLFAGESQAETVIEGWATMGAATLVCTSLVKTCLTPLCIRNGWRGGNIFPLIFSGICLGYALAALTGATPGLAVCLVVATLCGTVMRKPLGTVALMLLCFPCTASCSSSSVRSQAPRFPCRLRCVPPAPPHRTTRPRSFPAHRRIRQAG